MVGYVVFGVFCAAMVVLAGFVIRFSVKLSRERRGPPPRRGKASPTPREDPERGS